jgi:hypothetical protein
LVASRLEQATASIVCRKLSHALTASEDPLDREFLCKRLLVLSDRLGSDDGKRLRSVVIRALLDQTLRDNGAGVSGQLVATFADASKHMSSAELSETYIPAVALLCHRVSARSGTESRGMPAVNLTSLFSSISGEDRSRICSRVCNYLRDSIRKETNEQYRSNIAERLRGLTRVVSAPQGVAILISAIEENANHPQPATQIFGFGMMQMMTAVSSILMDALAESVDRAGAVEARTVCDWVAPRLRESLVENEPQLTFDRLGALLERAARHLPQAEASEIADQTIRVLMRARSARGEFTDLRLDAITRLLPHLDSQIAIASARELATFAVDRWNSAEPFEGTGGFSGVTRMTGMTAMGMMGGRSWPTNLGRSETFNLILTDNSRAQVSQKIASILKSAGAGFEGALTAASRVFAQPFPCRLTTQELVDLLKMPTCFGAARRVVLDHLGNRYGRRFVNHWAFVRFATDQKLNLDFTTPPRRPEPIR